MDPCDFQRRRLTLENRTEEKRIPTDGRGEDNSGRAGRGDETGEDVEEEKRGLPEQRGRAGCYLSHHKAVITFSLPDRSLATLLVAPRSISG